MKKILICVEEGLVKDVVLPGFEEDCPDYAIFDLNDLWDEEIDVREHWIKLYSSLAAANKEAAALPSHWEDDPDHPVEDWRYEVANDDTRLGYREWIQHRKEIESHKLNMGETT